MCDAPAAPLSPGTAPRGITASRVSESLLSQSPTSVCLSRPHKTAQEGYLFAHPPLSSEIRHRVWPDPEQTGEGEGRRERRREEEESCCCWRGFARLAERDVVQLAIFSWPHSLLYVVSSSFSFNTCRPNGAWRRRTGTPPSTCLRDSD